MKLTFRLFSLLLLALVSCSAAAKNKVVVVPLFDSTPSAGVAGVAGIPVYCAEIGLIPRNTLKNITCLRADTREIVTPVPDGYFLFVTDVVTNRNNLATSGLAFINISRNNGSTFGAPPRLQYTYNPTETSHLRFSSSYLIFHEGERLAAFGSGDVLVDLFISGYLVKADAFSD